jgi:2'-5' RNA ligase
MNTFRLFVAIDTPREVKEAMTGLRDHLKRSGADVRWESSEKLHITLKFIGDTPQNLLPDFVPLLEGVAANRQPFGISYFGIGCFPHRQDPRVVWVGVEDPTGGLATMQRAIEAGCISLGFPAEQKGFHAHVTLGRVKSRRNLGSLLATMESATFEGRQATVSALLLLKSELKPGGSEYTILKQFPLQT